MSQRDRAPRLVVSRTIGQLILDYRKQNDIRQAVLAEEWGVRPATLGDWENGRSKPQSRFFPLIAERLGISPDLVASTVRGYVSGDHGGSEPSSTPPTDTDTDKELEIRWNISKRLAANPPPSAEEVALMLELLTIPKDERQQPSFVEQSANPQRMRSEPPRPAAR